VSAVSQAKAMTRPEGQAEPIAHVSLIPQRRQKAGYISPVVVYDLFSGSLDVA